MPNQDIAGTVQRGSLQIEAYEQLKEKIILQELEPGQLVSEAELSKALQIGRTPIRVAIQKLAYEGFVTVLPQRGIVVSEIHVEKHLKLLEVRAELERLMVRAAVRHATLAQRNRMGELAQQLIESANAEDSYLFMAILKDIHQLTNEAANNEILSTVINIVQGLSRRFWFAHHGQFADLNDAAQLHARRIQAIMEKDEERAIESCDRLVEYLERYTLETIKYQGKSLAHSLDIMLDTAQSQ